MHSILGTTVSVTVDRAMGSVHPRCPDIRYPVNYGYIEGVPGGDGSWQDAYILGIARPLERFTGQVIAVIHRLDDVEDKWVVVPEGMRLYKPEIVGQTRFVERYFQAKYRCLYEKACGGILYTVINSSPRFLLIENESGHIGFPKGHVEYGESERMTALREIYEETSVRAELVWRHRWEYTVRREYNAKTYVHFLARYQGQTVRPQHGEITRWWLLPYFEAQNLLNFATERAHLAQAYEVVIQSL